LLFQLYVNSVLCNPATSHDCWEVLLCLHRRVMMRHILCFCLWLILKLLL
jgi:hypothetical protein